MKSYIFLIQLIIYVFCPLLSKAQEIVGRVYTKDNADIYLNQIYVTNLNTQSTVLSSYNGDFHIAAKIGDEIRFTSIVTERKSIIVTQKILDKLYIVELLPEYKTIPEVKLGFKPSGNLKKDVLALKNSKNPLKVEELIGLPEPKGDGDSPESPLLGFNNGSLGLSIEGLLNMINGNADRNKRLKNYEIMQKHISEIRKYFGDSYFINLKIPTNLIDDFLQFIYLSEDLKENINQRKYDSVTPYIQKYLPIYYKRLKSSHYMQNNHSKL